MRIERTGKVEPLTPRLVNFMIEALGGKSFDELHLHQECRIDYACLNGLLAIEMKSLEVNVSERMGNLTDELIKRNDWPRFLGSAPMESFVKNMDDPDAIRRKVLNRVGRAIINDLKKADKQLAAHTVAFPRKNLVRVMLLINEDHEAYDPHTVSYILGHALQRQENGRPLYSHVDSVLYMDERHASIKDNRIVFPVLIVGSPVMADSLWKCAVLDRFVKGWAAWNCRPNFMAEGSADFATIDHIPDSAPLHERWRTQYKRDPYMRGFTDEGIRQRFDESNVVSCLAMVKDSPMQVSQESMMRNMATFTHLMFELAERGIPMTALKPTRERIQEAARRLGFHKEVLVWLEQLSCD